MTAGTACVVGWPIEHSRSPLIHNHWLKELAIDGAYTPIAVEPERAARFFAGFAESDFVGGNVTIPFKALAFEVIAEADEIATALGAVNTLYRDRGQIVGSNTDVYGFLANLDAELPGWTVGGHPAVVLGAGGAARAVVWALRASGFEPVIVVNRTADRAEELVAKLGPGVRAAGWSELEMWLRETAILVNATSLGMKGQPPLEVELGTLRDNAIVHDLVYAPLETELLKAARTRGLRTADGLGMLLHQAVPGFEKWFGQRPSVTAKLRQLVVADLATRP